MHDFPFYHLYHTNLDLFNINWRNLKRFDAIFVFYPSLIYYYHKQNLNQLIYMPDYLYYELEDITPAKLQSKNLIMTGRASPAKRYYLAIGSFKYTIKDVPECKLIIVSESNKNLIKLSNDFWVYEHFIFTGIQKDVHK